MTEPPDIDALVAEASAAIASASSIEDIRKVATAVSGKRSPLAEASRALGAIDPDARKALGQKLHEARTTIEALIEDRRNSIESEELAREMTEARIDLTEFIPGSIPAPRSTGHLHLVT